MFDCNTTYFQTTAQIFPYRSPFLKCLFTFSQFFVYHEAAKFLKKHNTNAYCQTPEEKHKNSKPALKKITIQYQSILVSVACNDEDDEDDVFGGAGNSDPSISSPAPYH